PLLASLSIKNKQPDWQAPGFEPQAGTRGGPVAHRNPDAARPPHHRKELAWNTCTPVRPTSAPWSPTAPGPRSTTPMAARGAPTVARHSQNVSCTCTTRNLKVAGL